MDYQYMVHVWGGAWNKAANPSIEKDLGIKSGYHYFKTESAKDAFCELLDNRVYREQGLVVAHGDGQLTGKRTVFVGVFVYEDDEFILHYDFGYDYPAESAIYMFTHGNYSCDCNRSMFIRNQYGETAMPALGCGCEIEMIDYQFVYLDGTKEVYYHE